MEIIGTELKEFNPIAKAFTMMLDEMENQEKLAREKGLKIPDVRLLFKQPGKISEPKREGANFEELVKQRMRPIKKLIETHNLGAPVAGNFFQVIII